MISLSKWADAVLSHGSGSEKKNQRMVSCKDCVKQIWCTTGAEIAYHFRLDPVLYNLGYGAQKFGVLGTNINK